MVVVVVGGGDDDDDDVGVVVVGVVDDDVDVDDNDVYVDRLEAPLRGGIDLERSKKLDLSLLALIDRDDAGEKASVLPPQRRRGIVDET